MAVFAFSPSVGHLDPGFLASDKTSSGNAQINEEINIASSDSEVEIVGVQEHARYEFLFLALIFLLFYQNICIAKINKEKTAGFHFCSYPYMTDAQKVINVALVFSILLVMVMFFFRTLPTL